ncbi:hypothetical protein A3K73_06765 [Candidatus Pacearchaeota archaeon RBG_13_36_9]|nr:MAG: hypothetical protein A3K73_06765 [Candidatus Pacearchaeota archaeon RBG_13_36_9]
MNKKVILLAIACLSLLSIVSAYRLVCLQRGEPYPAGNRTCLHDICQICTTDDYLQAHSSHCNDIGACELLNGTSVDGEAPNITVRSPVDNTVYLSTSVLLNFKSNEPCTLYYIDNLNGRGRWKRTCSDCTEYSRNRRFEEGLNDITIKCVDDNGNKAEVRKVFRVDSKKPKITKTEPLNGFSNGIFEAQFVEENPFSLILNYGTYSVIRKKPLNISRDCYKKNGKNYCSIDADLREFDGKEIDYWFELKDMANQLDISKHIDLQVDTTPPVLNNPGSFWQQGAGREVKYIYFNFNVTEENFDEITYYDSSDSNPRWRRLCGRLKDGICQTKKSFRNGNHIVDIQISDEAGNAIAERISFLVAD